MTLIAAFRCKDDEGRDAFVISAESQETQGDYRFFLEKLEPIKTGNFVLVIGGSGFGDLVDAFHLRLTEVLPSSNVRTMDELRKIVKAELLDFIRVEVEAFAAPKKDKYTRFLIGAFGLGTRECECWLTRSAQLKPVKKFEIIGIESAFYKDMADRLHSVKASIGQTVRLSLHLLMVVKRTSNYADGPTSLFVISRNGVWEEEERYIKEAEQHLEELNSANDALSVALPDLGLFAVEFEATLQDFVEKVRSIRKKYARLAAETMFEHLQKGAVPAAPYGKFPAGGSFQIDRVNGKMEVLDVGDNPHIGRYIGTFDSAGTLVPRDRTIKYCGKKRVVENRVFAQVVPCKQRAHQTQTENCIEDKWLETLEANYTDDDQTHTR
jgi:hypothetical protein